jgi:putative transport protein
MIQILVDNPLLVFVLVAAIGYAVGQITIGGTGLGIAAVLFVGLAFGALDPRLKLPDAFYLLGLVLFVYTIGLSSGPTFFRSLRRQGLRDILLCIGMLVLGAALLAALQPLLGLPPTVVAGLFAGSFTNTPALASVLDYIRTYAPAATRELLLSEPVIGYSAAYPLGVIGPMLVMLLLRRIWRVDYAGEAAALRAQGLLSEQLHHRTIRVTHAEATQQPLAELTGANRWDVVFGRVRHGQQLALATAQTCFAPGDLVAVVGTAENLDRVTHNLGEVSDERLDSDRRTLDYRRIFVSNPSVAGHPLKDLHLMERFGATVTRVRRGDSDLLPHGDTVLELGDRVRVVTDPTHLESVSDFFGDSYRALSEVNMLSLCLGLGAALAGLCGWPAAGGAGARHARAHRAAGLDAALQRQPDPAPAGADPVPGRHRHARRLGVSDDLHAGQRAGAAAARRADNLYARAGDALDRLPGLAHPDEHPARHDRRAADAPGAAELCDRAGRQRCADAGLCCGLPGRDHRQDHHRAAAAGLDVVSRVVMPLRAVARSFRWAGPSRAILLMVDDDSNTAQMVDHRTPTHSAGGT